MHIHYDCDPGQDDAVALLFALGAGVNITSISIVGGNVDVEKCTRNALQLLEFTARTDILVYKGAACPLKRLSQPLPDVFGECGMAGANLPEPATFPAALYAPDYMAVATLPATWVATGPLTNLALALKADAALAARIETLIIMGGCVYPEHIHNRLGNIQVKNSDGWAEYNFAVDPEAAQIVFSSGIKTLCLIPLEVTRKVLYGRALDNALRGMQGRAAILAADILATIGSDDRADYASVMQDPTDPVRAMHDVVAMAYLTNSEIFTTQTLPLRIETGAPPTPAGQSVIDPAAPDHPAVTLITGLDAQAFSRLMVQYLAALP